MIDRDRVWKKIAIKRNEASIETMKLVNEVLKWYLEQTKESR